MSKLSPVLAILSSVILTGCASAPDPVLYTLSVPKAPQSVEPSQEIIGLSEVDLPAYARNVQITSAVNDFQIIEDDDHRWAVPPSEAITSTLAGVLEQRTGQKVVKRPYPAGLTPGTRVSISFDRLIRDPSGAASLKGQFILIGAKDEAVLESFELSVPANGKDYDQYMSALSRAIDALGADIAESISIAAESQE